MRSMECFDLNKLFSNWRGVLLVLAGLVVLGLVVWALRCIPPWQVEQVRARLDTPEKYEYRLATLKMSTAEPSSRVLAASSYLWGCI